jgi:hypothetical protein
VINVAFQSPLKKVKHIPFTLSEGQNSIENKNILYGHVVNMKEQVAHTLRTVLHQKIKSPLRSHPAMRGHHLQTLTDGTHRQFLQMGVPLFQLR